MVQQMTERHTPALKPLKWYRNLATRNGRLEAGAFLVEGDRAIEQVVHNNPGEVLELLTTAELPLRYRGFARRVLTEGQLHSISSTKTPQGTIAIVRLPLDTYTDQLPASAGERVLLLEDVQDPGNVGTLIRTAVAFGFSGVIMTEDCADLFSPKCVQSTAGTILALWARRTPRYLTLVEQLRQSGYTVVAADVDGHDTLDVLGKRDRLLLALGNEASGLTGSLLDTASHRVRIPTVRERAESLNVAACGAICMYLSYREERAPR